MADKNYELEDFLQFIDCQDNLLKLDVDNE